MIPEGAQPTWFHLAVIGVLAGTIAFCAAVALWRLAVDAYHFRRLVDACGSRKAALEVIDAMRWSRLDHSRTDKRISAGMRHGRPPLRLVK